MDGVSDAAFRYITAKYGKPDVITTEFVSVDGIVHAANTLFRDFWFDDIERPILGQIFGIDPKLFYISAQIIAELGFDGVDINMGCPARTVSGRGAGAGLIRTPALALEIIAAVKDGLKDWYENGLSFEIGGRLLDAIIDAKCRINSSMDKGRSLLPVSVKTRIGYDSVEIDKWIPILLESHIANLTVHGRTLKQMYKGEADWQSLKRVGEIVHEYNRKSKYRTSFIANGDISSPEVAFQRLTQVDADGIYIGRGSYGDPWIFERVRHYLNNKEILVEESIYEKARVVLEHCQLHYELFGEASFVQMRKHLAWYIRGFSQAKEIRVSLLKSNNPEEVRHILLSAGLLPES